MRVIAPSFNIEAMDDRQTILSRIESAGRVCYKSEEKITPESAAPFVGRIISSGHLSVIEHASCTVRIVCDRGITHEIVRHRLASFSQESTRYANYANDKFGNEITVIKPCFWAETSEEYAIWHKAMLQTEKAYLDLISKGASAQQARSVLPNSLKTEIIVTANLREWRHIFSLRCSARAHPQMREIMLPLLGEMHSRLPELFADFYGQYKADIAAKTWQA